MRTRNSVTTVAAILSSLAGVDSISLDCEKVIVDGVSFNLKPLGGPHSIYQVYDTGSAIRNTTFTIDICAALEKVTDKHCTNGARSKLFVLCRSRYTDRLVLVCAFERFYDYDAKEGAREPAIADSWSIAGEFIHENRHLEPTPTRLKGSDSHADSEKEGVRIELSGGVREATKQKAFVEFVCDQTKSGLEGLSIKNERRAEEGGGEKEGEGTKPLPNPNEGKSLQLISYKDAAVGKEEEVTGVLRMEWKTKYACEQQKDADKDKETTPGTTTPSSSQGWGFFTWFIIM